MDSESKRKVATLIPYLSKGGSFRYFLQRRDKDATYMSDHYGIFGGGIEGGETPEQAMVREIQEELTLGVKGYRFFSRYEFVATIHFVFAVEVDDDFESKIEVREGQYGKWFTIEDIKREPMMTPPSRVVLVQFDAALRGVSSI